MKILVVSDIHGNLPAIEAVFKLETDWDQCISLGDVVDYGPWGNECVDLLENIPNCMRLMGNHERYFLDQNFEPGSLTYAFYQFCLSLFTRGKVIKKYAHQIRMNNFTLQHTIGNQYIFPDTLMKLDGNYFVGHSHRQFIYEYDQYKLVNPGSVGQNRQFINRIDYAVWYPESSVIELKNIIYDVGIVINEMKIKNYPEACIAYYENKPRI